MKKKQNFFPVDYRTKDPRVFLYHWPSNSTPAFISKSFSNFLYASAFELMDSLATHKKQIILPFKCVTGKRLVYLKDKNYLSFKIAKESYFMLNESELEETEKKNLQEYLKSLKWNYTYTRFSRY